MRKALNLLRLVERTSIVTIFLVMVFLFFFNVLVRELASSYSAQFAWIEEAVRLLNLFLVFGGLGLALERGRHVSIDTIRNKLPEHQRKWLIRAIDLSGAIISFYVALLGYRLMVFVLGTGQKSPTLDLPMGWIYLAPLLGFSLLGLRYLLNLFGIINRFENAPRTAEEGENAS
ncbi:MULTISPECIES: TRAP transporter small permease [Pseudovibrio]|uniref:TRAP transporter small permease n=1 Tax=Stappiaceae TaxID=2821832 RepID=UPI002367288C|nr:MULTISPECIES: TRAP transporter small permease [Pseudovibrio]MDD7909931.1 TRAP transporter small permease [Pseudovibrio exalbescens]MDX5592268.1 TRAP transporter small permease [Pseudovibrio sp. SPO723]